MGAAIELFGAVYTTAGGTRYHADPACYALASGRGTQAYRAGEGAYGESWYGAQYLDGLYPLVRRSTISAVQRSRTACLRCVPSAWAMQPLPLVTFDYGHRPVNEYEGTPFRTERIVCARCVRWVRWRPGTLAVGTYVAWPCTSALVLGLVARGGGA